MPSSSGARTSRARSSPPTSSTPRYKGTGQFDGKPLKNLRALGALYPEQVQLVTATKSNIRNFRDLKGKSVSSGSPGSGQWQLLGDLLEVYGMTRKDIGEDLSSFTQSVDKIKDGNLVASLITAGAPTSSIVDLANGHDIRIVPLAGPEIEALRKKQPYYANVQLPAEHLQGTDGARRHARRHGDLGHARRACRTRWRTK